MRTSPGHRTLDKTEGEETDILWKGPALQHAQAVNLNDGGALVTKDTTSEVPRNIFCTPILRGTQMTSLSLSLSVHTSIVGSPDVQ